ncbi:MAG: FG-GAP-like repeat-containing protein, partial [Limisphaerales bacterium]
IYFVVVSNSAGSTNSEVAVLAVSTVPPEIFLQPNDRIVEVGSSLQLSRAGVKGSRPMTNQWIFNGNTPVPSYSSHDQLISYSYPDVTNVQYEHAGTYQLFVTNSFGSASTIPITVKVVPSTADSLDIPGLHWTKSGWVSQTNVTYDGADAMQSSAGPNGTFSFLQTTMVGSNVLSFWFKIAGVNDSIHFDIGGVEQWSFSGITDWRQHQIIIPPGNRTIRFRARNGADHTEGLVWLDQISVTELEPLTFVAQPQQQKVSRYGSATFSGLAEGRGPISYQWQRHGTDIPGATNTVLTLNNVQPGDAGLYQLIVRNAAQQMVSAKALLSVASITSDLNSDGHADLFWVHNNGEVRVWNMDNTNRIGASSLGFGPALWRLAASADINRDGQVDLLWQHPDGRFAVWLMNGTSPTWQKFSHFNFGQNRRLAGAADFTRNGYIDLLWHMSDDRIAISPAEGLQIDAKFVFLREGRKAGVGWRIAAIGDLNGDSNPDILWQHNDGRVAAWLMSGLQFSESIWLNNDLPVGHWRLVGAEDLNGDSHLDLFWQNDEQQVALWWMNGTNRVSSSFLNNGQPLPSGWRFAGPRGNRVQRISPLCSHADFSDSALLMMIENL